MNPETDDEVIVAGLGVADELGLDGGGATGRGGGGHVGEGIGAEEVGVELFKPGIHD